MTRHTARTLGSLLALGLAWAVTGCMRGDAMSFEGLQALGSDYTTGWNSGNPTAVAAFFETSGSLKVNDAEPAVGRDAIAEGFVTGFPDMVLVMDSVRMAETGVEYHWTFMGTNTGPGGSGHAVRFSGYEEWTLSEVGLITQSLGHFDEAEYNRQLQFGVAGADPTGPAPGR